MSKAPAQLFYSPLSSGRLYAVKSVERLTAAIAGTGLLERPDWDRGVGRLSARSGR